MRKFIILSLGLLILSCQPGEKDDLTLDAQIDNVDDGTAVYISELTKGNQPVPLDTVTVKNGKISVNLQKVDFQTLEILSIDGVSGNMLFINENKPLTATIYKDSLRSSKIEGGPANKLFTDYTTRLMSNNRKLMAMRQNHSKEDFQDPAIKKQLMEKQQEIQKENTAYRKKVIKENPNSLPTIFIFSDLMRGGDVSNAEMTQLYDGLSKNLKNTYIGKQIKQQLSQSKAVSIGSKAPGFSAKTPDGKELSLEDAMAKYTLIDFWASWCKPCRKENPNIVKAYEKYHDKGFTVLGVSLDKTKSAWTRAIKDDGLAWNQISNLKFWQDPIAKKYNVRAIPASFLIDENGIIIAKNLRGSNLEKKIKELLEDQ